MPRNIVIVGAGLSALRTTERILADGWDERLTLLGAEPHPPYTRPPLTKEFLQGEGDFETVELRRRPAFDRVDSRWSAEVVGADLAAREVRLADGEVIAYDGLVIATGLSPRRLAWGPEGPATHVIRTIADAQNLRVKLQPGVRVAVIGAGFVGCEVAASARTVGCSVHLIDPFDAPLTTQLGPIAGTLVARWLTDAGVDLHLGTAVERLSSSTGGPILRLANGLEIEADVVVEAVGGIPNTAWLEGNGLDLRDGVLCDSTLHPVTEGGSIFSAVAVGDVARFPMPRFGSAPRRIEHWSHAADTGAHGARALLAQFEIGAAPTFTALPSFWSHLFEHRIQSVGLPAAGMADQRMIEETPDESCVVGYYDAGRLVGVVLFDCPQRLMHFRVLVEESADLVESTPR